MIGVGRGLLGASVLMLMALVVAYVVERLAQMTYGFRSRLICVTI